MNTKLLTTSNNKRKTAYEIIDETSIESTLSKLGKVEVVGSLKLDLMFRNDIDILVISDDISNAKAIDTTHELLKSKKFRTVGFADYQTYPEKEIPIGYYWELIVMKNNQEWKFDIWYLKPTEKYTHLVMDSLERFNKELSINPSKRETILEIKEEYFNGVKYKDNVKSIDIYKAVLDNNIDTVVGFRVFKGK